MKLIRIVQQCCPPALLSFYRRHSRSRVRFHGDFDNWQTALEHASGYDDDAAIAAIRSAALTIKQQQFGWERDGKLFASPLPDWPVRACLSRAAAANKGRLRVLDFGGALGTSYQQHAAFLQDAAELDWVVVEQPRLSLIGQQEFSSPHLHFFDHIGAASQRGDFQIALLACVLPYLEHPYRTLEDIAATAVPSILLHRTPLIETAHDRLTVQTVPASLYPASYPAWFFSEQRLHSYMATLGYQLAAQYDCDDSANIPSNYQGLMYECTA